MKTIESIRNKDPKIYDKNTKWYTSDDDDNNGSDDEENSSGINQKKSSKKKTFKDVIREQLLSNNTGEDDDNLKEENSRIKKVSTFQYDKEQEELRKNLLLSAAEIDSDNENDDENENDDNLLIKKKKDPIQIAKEEKELQEVMNNYLKKSQSVTEDDLFLVNYMKEKKWIDNVSKQLKDSTNKQQQGANSLDDEYAKEDEILDLEEDEKDLIEIDRFESKYNFRFEELQNGLFLLVILSLSKYLIFFF